MRRKLLLTVCLLIVSLFFLQASAAGQKLKIEKVTVSSSENNPDLKPENLIDGNMKSRWASEFSDPQWISLDFGSSKAFNLILLEWENAYGKKFEIQVSDDAEKWKTVYKEENGDGKKDAIPVGEQKSRYVRIYGIERGTSWGYSLYEIKVFKDDGKLPVAPSGLSADPGYVGIALSWNPLDDEVMQGYNVYRSTNQKGFYKKINEKIIGNPNFMDNSIRPDISYFYYVTAVNGFNRESAASEKKQAKTVFIEKKGTYLDRNLSADERVKDLISRMTLKEEVDLLSGPPDGDAFSTKPNEKFGIPSLKTTDGPWGVNRGKTTAFPVPIAIASTWSPDLMEKIGKAIGIEALARGRNVSLGPCLNMATDPRGGRVHEGYGEDPYLSGKMASADIRGIQSENVVATPKHLACNNKEDGRFGGPVEIDERSLREFYLPAFKACVVEADAWSMMTGHNKINGDYCANNQFVLKKIVRDEWKFRGFFMSDWGGTYDTVKSANAGMDLEMPFTKIYGQSLIDAVNKGSVDKKAVDFMAGNILRVMFLAGLFDQPKEVKPEMAGSAEHIQLSLEAARKGIVLLKNEKNILPLDRKKIKKIAIKGPAAKLTPVGEDLGSGQVYPAYFVSPYDGIKNKIGSDIEIIDSVKDADVVIIFAGLHGSIDTRQEGEGTDRKYLHLSGNQDETISSMAKENKNTVVVLIDGTAVTMDRWINGVSGVVQAWYCGQEGGNAIADVLFGDYNPGGKLPITFPQSIDQLPPFDWDYRNDFANGVGYRYYDKKKLEPLFPFGYGLSYTKFQYENMNISPKKSDDGKIRVSLDVKNTGLRKGDEVVQLYVHMKNSSVERPLKELKKFERITLDPGESKNVVFMIEPADLAVYDKELNYIVEPGTVDIMVGSSSRDIRLTSQFVLEKGIK